MPLLLSRGRNIFNNFGCKLFFHALWGDLRTLCSFPICCKVTIMVIRDIKSKSKIATNCNNPFSKVYDIFVFLLLIISVLHKSLCRGSLDINSSTVNNKTRGNCWWGWLTFYISDDFLLAWDRTGLCCEARGVLLMCKNTIWYYVSQLSPLSLYKW